MARLDLLMHIGWKNKISKTEAVFFHSRTKIQSWMTECEKNSLPHSSNYNITDDINKKIKKIPLKNQKK